VEDARSSPSAFSIRHAERWPSKTSAHKAIVPCSLSWGIVHRLLPSVNESQNAGCKLIILHWRLVTWAVGEPEGLDESAPYL
jgi:hypothetical protein